ncbi:hypothetical protein [Geminocystis sp. GBBB08]|uniref:hypothetical protein n=1 Tax=Geminocystis sp. GBBB08 TaxID=2604140 RepID=UPI0027E2A164|nr:hypothetical protein [Geminocystis sp. GBBB08]MBL1210299.1 hypothetical protein [Geminocystis sp. GBBB08]
MTNNPSNNGWWYGSTLNPPSSLINEFPEYFNNLKEQYPAYFESFSDDSYFSGNSDYSGYSDYSAFSGNSDYSGYSDSLENSYFSGNSDYSGYSDYSSSSRESDSLENSSSVTRFQNKNVPGTYLFAGEQESRNIRQNFPNFAEEGIAFKVGIEPGDDLIRIYRFSK